ncbi:MAG: ribonuclease M5 [Bacilli bacterium]|jgi:ribonuclease M5|nr:ribonuclease M5 [Bacilli bacterium]
MKINEVIVVEGYHDMQHLKNFIDADIIVTNGSALNEDTISLIKKANETRGVIIFTDPDYPGEKIRDTIVKRIGNTKHAFLKKEDAIDIHKHKVGIEHASPLLIKEALSNTITFNINDNTLTWHDYLSLNLSGNKQKRLKLCNYLNIGPCNNKTLYHRLNMINLNKDKIFKIMEVINE